MQDVNKLWEASLSSNTQGAYKAGLQCLLTFVTMSGGYFKSGELPVLSEQILIFFVTHCHTSLRLKWTTIKLYLAGIRYHYIKAGRQNPFQSVDRLQYILRGIKRTQTLPSKPRLPITIQVLNQLCGVFKTEMFSQHMGKTMECMCVTAFFGFLRCSEFTVGSMQHHFLRIQDIKFSKDKAMFTLFLASSKTDPFRSGITISFFKNKFLCPVTCMWNYIVGVRKQSLLSNAPLFVDERGHPISRDLFISYLRQTIKHLGFSPPDYCGHSFRIGAATTAAAVGIEDHMIKTLGRWKSSCYMRYIHVDKGSLKEAQQKLTQG